MSSSPFNFPYGDGRQVLHDMSVQSRRAERENPASVRDSILGVAAKGTVQTLKYASIKATLPDIWYSDTLTVPTPDRPGMVFAFASLTGNQAGLDAYLVVQILRNNLVVCDSSLQGATDNLAAGPNPPIYGSWANLVDPGDAFGIRCGIGNGPVGLSATATNVVLSLTTIFFPQS